MRIAKITESLFDASGKLTHGGFGALVSYDPAPLAAALASSTDGSFTAVPFSIQDPNEDLPESATLTVTVLAIDSAGNLASSSVSVSLPPAVPPPFPPSDAPVLAMSHAAIQPYRTTLGFPDLGNPKFFVASGTLETFVAPISRFHGLTGAERYSFALADASDKRLDCQTPEKTADEWGITHKVAPYFPFDWDAPYVSMGPFSGAQCQISAGSSVHVVPIRPDFPREALYMETMGDNDYSQNFIAYGPPPPPPPPPPPDPCATFGACVSSVLFLPGMETSRLYFRDILGVEHQVWEPDVFTDIPHLALKADGTSRDNLYTKDIIGELYDNAPLEQAAATQVTSPDQLQIYGDWEKYLNTLTASTTSAMHEWRAYPYDWRYDVRDIVANGTETEEPDGSLKRVYLEDVLAEMASSSATGKVTIIGHSYGGLLAKALIKKLEADGKSDLVDRLVMVGAPQWGTPKDIGALLHGDEETIFYGLIMSGKDVRKVAHDLPDPYDLLPSPAYFARVRTPVATFEPAGLISGAFAKKYGEAITSFSGFTKFLEDMAGLDAGIGDENDLHAPLPLRSDLVNAATATHDALDSWMPPANIAVTAIAGWGQQTVSGIQYTTASKAVCTSVGLFTNACVDEPTLRHAPLTTQDGDGTVVTPSAVGNAKNVFYFNAKEFLNQHLGTISHQNILSALPIEVLITSLLENNTPQTNNFIKESQPTGGLNPLAVASTHSPVNLLVTDVAGNQTGIVPIPGMDFSAKKEQIPGSSVFIVGDEQYVYVPASGTYTVSATGYAAGVASIEVGKVAEDGSIETTAAFTNVPVASGTALALTVNTDKGTTSALSIDEDGDKTVDATLELMDATTTSYAPPQAKSATSMHEDSGNTTNTETPPPPPPVQSNSGGGGGGISFAPAPVALAPPSSQLIPSAQTQVPPSASSAPALQEVTPSVPSLPSLPASVAVNRSQSITAQSPSTAEQTTLETSVTAPSARVQPSPATASTQGAVAYSALSQQGARGLAAEVYHLVQTVWMSVLHFFTRFL